MTTGTLAFVALSLLAATPPVASSPTTRVGVLPLVIAADAAPEVGDARQRLAGEVRDTLAETTYEVVSLSTEQTGDAKSPYCKDAVCWQQLATQHDVTHFLVVIVHFTNPDYRIEAKLVDGRSGSDAGALEKTCDLCGISELEARVRDVAATMRREIEATMLLPPTLVVTSTPLGAAVRVDGEPVGMTPLELTTVPGVHEVEVSHVDYVSEAQEVQLVNGVRREVTAFLRRRPVQAAVIDQPQPTLSKADRRLFGLGAAALLLGTGAVAGGGVMIAIDDGAVNRDCDGSNVDEAGRCRYLHDTLGGGVAFIVTGVAGMATGVALMLISRRRASRARAQLWPSGAGVTGRF